MAQGRTSRPPSCRLRVFRCWGRSISPTGSATAALAYQALAKGGKLVQAGIFGGELTLSLVGLEMRAVSVMGNNTGSIADLREVARLANEGRLPPLPVSLMPRDDANLAMTRLRDGKVTGRIVLTADGA